MHAAYSPFPWFHFRDWRDRISSLGLARRDFSFGNSNRILPDYTTLKDYEPPVMTRVHASDGSLIAEYARERRLYLPSAAIPDACQGGVYFRRRQEFLQSCRCRS